MLKFFARKISDCSFDSLSLFEVVRSDDSCLLQSGGRGRFSIIGFDPFLKVEGNVGISCVFRKKGNGFVKLEFEEDPLDVLQELLDEFCVTVPDEFSWLPFCGGAVGYFSYDYGVHLMGVSQTVIDDVGTPDMKFLFFDKFFVFDEKESEVWICAVGIDGAEVEERLMHLERILDGDEKVNYKIEFGDREDLIVSLPKSNLSKEQYVGKIDEVLGFLRQGETYEVNFAHRFEGKTNNDSWEIYKALSKMNPSPYACYFEFEDFQIVSNSPERLVVCRDGVLETRPIKGTVPRGKTLEEDKKHEKQLLASKKDEAELNMIVDLARNDLSQVSESGSVEVTDHRVIEKYSHVQHTMSNIRAKKMKDADFADVVRALFPGGSVTGAPKKRTLEIIDELENFRRGVYCGSAGYVSFNGNFDLNIMIRTMTCENKNIYFHSGGAIVIDSVGEEEWDETLDKAGALRKAAL